LTTRPIRLPPEVNDRQAGDGQHLVRTAEWKRVRELVEAAYDVVDRHGETASREVMALAQKLTPFLSR
jgi:hypothetical protein